jgi:hypothetical protein
VKTTAGPVELERPRLRDASALGFASQLVGKGVARTHALEALVIASRLVIRCWRTFLIGRLANLTPVSGGTLDQQMSRTGSTAPAAPDLGVPISNLKARYMHVR